MKLAISISENRVDAPFDARFGRAAAFCIVDSENDGLEVHENPAYSAAGGAGVEAAQFVAGLGAQAVVSGAFGPHAVTALEAAGVEMYLAPSGSTATARELVSLFDEGELRKASGATGEGRHEGPREGR
ncbi:MAG TPA: NifB/NifX family molybdenum-iron cluster-binding protein [Spirochaetia bacterium]|nr:NifB/NifX family molybdenum-iron cluster-binding protein [Spirochaetia bacterium]